MMRHNRLSGSRLLSLSGMTVFNDLLTAFNALSQWTSLTLANTDLSVNAIGHMLLQLNSVKLCDWARLHETSRQDEMVRCPRQDAETFWVETEMRSEMHRS